MLQQRPMRKQQMSLDKRLPKLIWVEIVSYCKSRMYDEREVDEVVSLFRTRLMAYKGVESTAVPYENFYVSVILKSNPSKAD